MSAQPSVPFSVERREEDKVLLVLIREVLSNQHELDTKLSAHIDREETMLLEATERLTKTAFPDGDPDGHRRAHEAWIKSQEQKAEFWEKMKTEVYKWGIIGVLGFLATAAWVALTKGPRG